MVEYKEYTKYPTTIAQEGGSEWGFALIGVECWNIIYSSSGFATCMHHIGNVGRVCCLLP